MILPWDKDTYLIAADFEEEFGCIVKSAAIREGIEPLNIHCGDRSEYRDGGGYGDGRGSGSGFGQGQGLGANAGFANGFATENGIGNGSWNDSPVG